MNYIQGDLQDEKNYVFALYHNLRLRAAYGRCDRQQYRFKTGPDCHRAVLSPPPDLPKHQAFTLHRYDRGITAIIAGHTHRAVFENLSLTEMRLQALRLKAEQAAPFQDRRDRRYYNTGSCVHPLGITGIEIILENFPHLRLIEWNQATESNKVTIKRDALREDVMI